MMPALPGGPLVQAIGWALLHLMWIATAVAMLLALVLAFLPGRSSLRYALSCLALALVVALGVGAGMRSYRAGTSAVSLGESSFAPILASAATAPAPAATSPARLERLQAWTRAASDALPLVVTVWLSGVSLFSVRMLIDWLRIRRLVGRRSPAAPAPWPAVARRLGHALGLRHVVRVVESAAVEVPSVVGLVRPAILLPTSALAGLTPAQLEMILAHELAHVRRHDFLVNLLQTVVETLLFHHPAVWWISRQIRAERENCCDDLAIAACGDRLQYARALLRLEELRARRFALAMSADGGSLIERIRRLALGSPRTSGAAVRAAGALAIPLVLLIAVALPAISSMKRAEAVPSETPVTRAVVNALSPGEAPPAAALAAGAEASDEGEPEESPPDETDETTPEPIDEPAEDEADADPASGNDGRPTLEELIALRTQNVTPAYVREMRSLLGKVSLHDVAGLKAVGVTPEYVRAMRRAGLAVETANEASGLAALGVTREFVREMRSVGFPVTSAQEAQGLRAVGVTAAYVREFRSRGLAVTAQEAQGLAALGVTPDYADALHDAGIEVTDAGELQSLKAVGITPEFVRRLAAAGYRKLSVKDLQNLGAAGVTGDFIREMSRYRTR